MYQDVYIEQSIRRRTPRVTKVYSVILILITVFVAVNFLVIDYRLYGLPLIVMIIVTYFATQNTKIEYDYTYTNGMLEITKIKRRNKRPEHDDVRLHFP